MPDVWKLGDRPGIDTDVYFPMALKHGFVTLGWGGTQDVSEKDEREIAIILKKWDPEYTRDKLSSNARDLFRFAHIPRGDFVVLYHRYNAYLGKVMRPYYWVPGNSPKQVRIFAGPDYGPHRLGVHWLFRKKPLEVDLSNLRRKVLRLGDDSIQMIPGLVRELRNQRRLSMPVDQGKPPKKSKSEVTRYIRDTAQSRSLKSEYGDECQVCGNMIAKKDGNAYSEAHHLWPLQNGGPDHMTNMLVLCPNHHAMFDFRAMGVDRDGKQIVQWKNDRLKQVGSLRFRKGHQLNEKYVLKHRALLKSS